MTIAFVAWLARAGSVVNFISETVLIGFKAGVALQLASDMLRVEGVEKVVGHIDRFTTLAGAIEDFQNGTAPRF